MGFFSDLFGSDKPDAPDYGELIAANREASQYARNAADADANFRLDQFNANRGRIAELQNLAKEVSGIGLNTMKTSNARADQQWQHYNENFLPVETQFAQEARDAGGTADQNRAAGRAVSDVRQQYAIAQGMQNRDLASMGINPNSGRFASINKGLGLRQTAAAAGAATNARETAKDKGIALRANAATLGRNIASTATQQSALGLQAGQMATGASTTAANAYLPGATYVSGGVNNKLAAAGLQQQGNLGVGGLMNNKYNAELNYESGQDDWMGGLLGLGGSLGSAYLLGSDEDIKENIEWIGTYENGLPKYRFEYKTAYKPVWGYGERIGTMAGAVEEVMPDAVLYHPDGYRVVDYSMVGV